MSERTSYKSKLRQEYERRYPDWNTKEDSDTPAYIPWLEQQIEALREFRMSLDDLQTPDEPNEMGGPFLQLSWFIERLDALLEEQEDGPD